MSTTVSMSKASDIQFRNTNRTGKELYPECKKTLPYKKAEKEPAAS